MSRVADIWGHLLLAGCTIVVIIHLLMRLKEARIKSRKTRFRALVTLFSSLIVLAVWLTVEGHLYSILVVVGVLLPIAAFLYSPLRLIMAVYRKRNVKQSLRYLLAAGSLLVTGVGAMWILSVPAPFKPAAESLALDLPVAEGWSEEPLKAAFGRADELGSLGVVVIHRGRIVVEWGDTDKVTDSHSVRKSILSVLIGIAIQKGLMDLDKTLQELGIDDKNPRLTPAERSATVEDLLRSSSGIYHVLLARNGRWEGRQIVPHQWITKSTLARSSSGTFGYGYFWWRSLGYPEWLSEDTFLATGTAGQKLLIDPYRELVVAHRTILEKDWCDCFISGWVRV